MVSIQEELASATGMCSDVLSIVDRYIWKPCADFKFEYNHTGGGKGHLINGDAHYMNKEIYFDAPEMFYPEYMNIMKKRRIIQFFVFKKVDTIKYQSLSDKAKIIRTFMGNFNKEFDDDRSPGFDVYFAHIGRICIADTTLAVICDYILKQIQHKYSSFPRDLSIIEVYNYFKNK